MRRRTVVLRKSGVLRKISAAIPVAAVAAAAVAAAVTPAAWTVAPALAAVTAARPAPAITGEAAPGGITASAAAGASDSLVRAPGVLLPRTRLPRLPLAASVTSGNWAGYAAVADAHVQLRYIRADFKIPALNCARSPVGSSGYAYVGHWVGLDGYNSTGGGTVEQVGVDASCNARRAASYYAWYETYPAPPVVYGGVRPGDSIATSVYYNGSGYNLVLADKTTGKHFAVTARCPAGSVCKNSSAEVITEDPGGAVSGGYNLADFAAVNYNGVAITSRNGTHSTLTASSLWTSSRVSMLDPAGQLMARPSALAARGQSFTVSWQRPS